MDGFKNRRFFAGVRTPSPGATKVTVDTWRVNFTTWGGWTPDKSMAENNWGNPTGVISPVYKWRDSTLLITGRGPTLPCSFPLPCWYCWWFRNLANQAIYEARPDKHGIFSISTGAGFLPSVGSGIFVIFTWLRISTLVELIDLIQFFFCSFFCVW